MAGHKNRKYKPSSEAESTASTYRLTAKNPSLRQINSGKLKVQSSRRFPVSLSCELRERNLSKKKSFRQKCDFIVVLNK